MRYLSGTYQTDHGITFQLIVGSDGLDETAMSSVKQVVDTGCVCKACNGTGNVETDVCTVCEGKGHIKPEWTPTMFMRGSWLLPEAADHEE